MQDDPNQHQLGSDSATGEGDNNGTRVGSSSRRTSKRKAETTETTEPAVNNSQDDSATSTSSLETFVRGGLGRKHLKISPTAASSSHHELPPESTTTSTTTSSSSTPNNSASFQPHHRLGQKFHPPKSTLQSWFTNALLQSSAADNPPLEDDNITSHRIQSYAHPNLLPALKSKDYDTLNRLFQYENVARNACNSFGESVIHQASRMQDWEVLRLLIFGVMPSGELASGEVLDTNNSESNALPQSEAPQSEDHLPPSPPLSPPPFPLLLTTSNFGEDDHSHPPTTEDTVRIFDDMGRTPLHDAFWSLGSSATSPQSSSSSSPRSSSSTSSPYVRRDQAPDFRTIQTLLSADPDLIYIRDRRGDGALDYVKPEWADLVQQNLRAWGHNFWPVNLNPLTDLEAAAAAAAAASSSSSQGKATIPIQSGTIN
jgi:hypothetical protein